MRISPFNMCLSPHRILFLQSIKGKYLSNQSDFSFRELGYCMAAEAIRKEQRFWRYY